MSVADFYQRSFQKFAGIDIPPNFKIDPNTDFIRVALEGKKIKYVPEKDFDTVTEYVDPQTVKQAPEKKKAAGAGIKKKIIQTWDDMPPHLKNIFKGGGKVMSFAAQKLASPAAGTLVGMAAYEEAIAQGTSQPRAIAKAAAIGATELLPVSFTDVKDTVGFIDKNREFYEEQRGTVSLRHLRPLN
jgi:hypothetical protein